MKGPRPVYITLVNHTYWVRYADRTYRRWHSPAQFYAPDITLEEVQEWVSARPAEFYLVDEPKEQF